MRRTGSPRRPAVEARRSPNRAAGSLLEVSGAAIARRRPDATTVSPRIHVDAGPPVSEATAGAAAAYGARAVPGGSGASPIVFAGQRMNGAARSPGLAGGGGGVGGGGGGGGGATQRDLVPSPRDGHPAALEYTRGIHFAAAAAGAAAPYAAAVAATTREESQCGELALSVEYSAGGAIVTLSGSASNEAAPFLQTAMTSVLARAAASAGDDARMSGVAVDVTELSFAYSEVVKV